MSVYEPTDWVNNAEPAINGDNLNKAERGIESAHAEIESIALGNTSVAYAETCNKARFTKPATQTVIGGVKVYLTENVANGEQTGIMNTVTIIDKPSTIVDFSASDNLPGRIRVDFTESTNTLWYDLFRDGLLVATNIVPGDHYDTDEGTWNFHVTSNNEFGVTDSTPDSGTAKAIPTEEPTEITDFNASDLELNQVIFNWTDYEDAISFNLYQEAILIASGVMPGHSLIIDPGTYNFHVRAVNLLGTTTSNIDEGTSVGLFPSDIIDFEASDDSTSIVISFTNLIQPVEYDLYRDSVLHRSGIHSGYILNSTAGTWNFHVEASNVAGTSISNIDAGTAQPSLYPPGEIIDFTATDDERRQITIDFTHSVDAEVYDLYENGILAATDIFPGYVLTGIDGTWSYYVEASNVKGSVNSNADSGTALPAFSSDPYPVDDFLASDDLSNSIAISFTAASNALRYDLYRDGELFRMDVRSGEIFNMFAGNWNFSVVGFNPIGDTSSNIDEGIALPATAAPGPIASFSASDAETNKIIMTFTESEGAARYDLYQAGIKIISGIYNGYEYITTEGTWSFFVRAVNTQGVADSLPDNGTSIAPVFIPGEITNFYASDDLEEEVMVSFSNSEGADTHDLYRDLELVAPGISSGYIHETGEAGTWDYYIVATNTQGTEESNHDTGTSEEIIDPPTQILDFQATDGIGEVVMSFTDSIGATHHDLYRNDNLVVSDIDTNYTYVVEVGTADYHILAVGAGGETESNHDTGTSLAVQPGEVTIDFASYTSIGSGAGTVDIGALGIHTFTPPAGVESLTVCMCGGGGAGKSDDNSDCGGGYRGEIQSFTLPTTGALMNVGIGAGGLGVSGGTNNGNPGEPTTLTGASAAAGGSGSQDGNYKGNEAAYISPCNGYTYYDGKYDSPDAYGGEAGAFGDGGDGQAPREGGIGAGGGGNDGTSAGGDGGNGRMHISWG